MAEKSSNSSLLEAIKNKLHKIDNKIASDDVVSKPFEGFNSSSLAPENAKDNIISENFSNKKTSIPFEAENSQPQSEIDEDDLDLDDESSSIKDLSHKISIESKIKEIAREIDDSFNFEEFEDDFEDAENATKYQTTLNIKNYLNPNSQNSSTVPVKDSKPLDPIDIELMNLEKEYEAKKKNNNSSSNSQEASILDTNQPLVNSSPEKPSEVADDEFKKYLDAQFEEELSTIDNKASQPDDSGIDKINTELNNQSQQSAKNYILPNFSPARDYLNSLAQQGENKSSSDPKNSTSYNNPSSQNTFKQDSHATHDDSLDYFPSSNQSSNNYANIGNNQTTSSEFTNSKFSDTDKTNSNNSQHANIKSPEISKSNQSLNRESSQVNYQTLQNNSLLKEEVIYQANNSLRKLAEAKNLVTQINNFADDEILVKIAMNIMEPKLEKWLNDNLPNLVEDIVRKEIEKIVPRS